MDIRAVAICFLRILQVFITVFQKSVFAFEHRHFQEPTPSEMKLVQDWGANLPVSSRANHIEVIGPIWHPRASVSVGTLCWHWLASPCAIPAKCVAFFAFSRWSHEGISRDSAWGIHSSVSKRRLKLRTEFPNHMTWFFVWIVAFARPKRKVKKRIIESRLKDVKNDPFRRCRATSPRWNGT